jgi:putative flippase GtrA
VAVAARVSGEKDASHPGAPSGPVRVHEQSQTHGHASKEPTMTTEQPATRVSKRDTLIYWTTTGIICAVMVFSIISFTFNDRFPFPDGKEGAFTHLGLPNYLKFELTVAKVLGVLALLIPSVPRKLKEFAYVGFSITLVSATIAHYSVGDARLSILYIIDPLIFFGVLVVSYTYFNKLFRPK